MKKLGLVWVGAVFCMGAGAVGMGVAQSSSSSSGSGSSPVQIEAPPVQGAASVDGSTAGSVDEDRLPAKEALKRDALMQPGLDALKRGDNATAYTALHSVLSSYPDDLFVLRSAAAAAMAAGQNEQAVSLFHQALAQFPRNPWPMRNAIIIMEARMDRWADFDRDVAALRQAKKNGMDHGLDRDSGFVIDEFDVGTGRVRAVVYPLGVGRYHTLYRFLLPQPVQMSAVAEASSAKNTSSARCQNPDFQPYMDAESDDIDQADFRKAHPDKAAKGERSYSLDSYWSPCSQALVGFYPDGEPAYEKVRAAAIRALTGPPKR